ncbi:MAG: hypothetical protein Q4D61_06510 [Cardiobacteriaceae bacterium]|nr:hypothetical protein [Cardiobacteriaceae bacterium]
MKRLLIPLALALAASAQAQNAAQQHANWTHQQNILHHHILPAQRAAAEAAAAQSAQPRTKLIGYYNHFARNMAFVIGSEPDRKEAHGDGHLLISTIVHSIGETAVNDSYAPHDSFARDKALATCASYLAKDGYPPNCHVIAEAANTCFAVAKGTAFVSELEDIAREGIWGHPYYRYYVAYLPAEVRGDPQREVSPAELRAWKQMVGARAMAMCQADKVHPLHACEIDYVNCALDSIERNTTVQEY